MYWLSHLFPKSHISQKICEICDLGNIWLPSDFPGHIFPKSHMCVQQLDIGYLRYVRGGEPVDDLCDKIASDLNLSLRQHNVFTGDDIVFLWSLRRFQHRLRMIKSYLATAAGSSQATQLIKEDGGKMTVEHGRVGPGADILDQPSVSVLILA